MKIEPEKAAHNANPGCKPSAERGASIPVQCAEHRHRQTARRQRSDKRPVHLNVLFLLEEQAEKESLHAYIKQLTVEKSSLEARLAYYRKQLANDIATLSEASKKTIREINDSLKLGIGVSLSEVNKLSEEAVRVGKEVGKLEARIESLNWIKPLLVLVKGENGLEISKEQKKQIQKKKMFLKH